MSDHVIRVTGNVADGYVLTEWMGHVRVKGIASYGAQDTQGNDCALEARGMALRHAQSIGSTYGARVEMADGPARVGRRGRGTACEPSRIVAGDPSGAVVCCAIRASYSASPYRFGGPGRRPAGHQRIGNLSDWLPACILMGRGSAWFRTVL